MMTVILIIQQSKNVPIHYVNMLLFIYNALYLRDCIHPTPVDNDTRHTQASHSSLSVCQHGTLSHLSAP